MLFLALTVVAGCAEPASGAYFPQHSLTADDPLPDALLEATLERVDDCIWLRSAGGQRYLGLWPGSFELRDAGGTFEILDGEGTVVGRGGESLTVGGGERHDPRALLGEEPLEACRTEGFWLVSEVLPNSQTGG